MWASLLIADWQVRLPPALQRGKVSFPKRLGASFPHPLTTSS